MKSRGGLQSLTLLSLVFVASSGYSQQRLPASLTVETPALAAKAPPQVIETELPEVTTPKEQEKLLSCERYMILNHSGDEVTLAGRYKRLDSEGVESGSRDLFEELGRLFESEAHAYSSRPYLVTEFFIEYFKPLYDLNNTISAKTKSGAEKPKALDDINGLLYGATSLDAKIQELQAAISKRKSAFRFQRGKKDVAIQEVAKELQVCRTSIKACVSTLPSILKNINDEFEMLGMVSAIITDQINIVESLKAKLPGLLSAGDLDNVELVLDRKVEGLNTLKMSVSMVRGEVEKMIVSLQNVISKSEEINGITIKQAVMDAGQLGIDISDLAKPPPETSTNPLLYAKGSSNRLNQDLALISSMQNKREKLGRIYQFLRELDGPVLSLEQFQYLYKMIPLNEAVFKDRYGDISEAIRSRGLASWPMPSRTPTDVILLWMAIQKTKLLKGSKGSDTFQAYGEEIKRFVRQRLSTISSESYIVDVLRLFNLEIERVIN